MEEWEIWQLHCQAEKELCDSEPRFAGLVKMLANLILSRKVTAPEIFAALPLAVREAHRVRVLNGMADALATRLDCVEDKSED